MSSEQQQQAEQLKQQQLYGQQTLEQQGYQKSIKAVSSNTIVAHGRKMEENCLRNIPSLAKSHGIKALRNQFKGCSAIVVGAGPSLDDALPLLKEHQSKFIIVAVDRALKPLLAAGITPHIVCASDMDKVLIDLFGGYRIPESIALVYDRDCYWELPKAWMGPLLAYDHYYDTGIWQSTFVGRKGFLCKNFTISHTAMYVARMLGCNPVVFTGVDFAYPQDRHHVAGAVHVGDEADKMARSAWYEIPGNVLPLVKTTEVFSICVPAMANGIQEVKADVINTSEIGAKIGGTRYQPLKQALEENGKASDYQSRINELLAAEPPSFDLEAFDAQTQHVLDVLQIIHDKCVEGLEIMRRLKKLDVFNSTENAKWKRIFLRSNALLLSTQENVFVQYLIQRAMLASTKKTKELLDSVIHLDPKDNKRLIVEAERHNIYFWSQGTVCAIFMKALLAARSELLKVTEHAQASRV